MKAIILLADGFEDVEALATRDILLRGGVEVTTISINEDLVVNSSHGLTLLADDYFNLDYKDFDAIILPGGKRGVDNLISNDDVLNYVKKAYNDEKLVCAICAAPSILIKLGILDGKEFTCYSSFEKGHKGKYNPVGVVVSNNVITGKSMYYSNEFGLAILEKLTDNSNKERIERQIKSL